MSQQPEKYMPPKEIATDLCARFGLCVSVGYIYAIRKESMRRGESVFIVHSARTSEVYEWIRRNPSFRKYRPSSATQLYST